MSEMNAASNANADLRVLSNDEMDAVNGGLLPLPAIVGTIVQGVAIRRAIDAFVSWLTD